MATRIILARHEEHEGNILAPHGASNARKNGVFLRSQGLVPEHCISSPEPRCVETALCVMHGVGAMHPIWTDARLGDARMGAQALTEDEIDNLGVVAKTHGTTPQAEILGDHSYHRFLTMRGGEGVLAIIDALKWTKDATLLVCSHHGSRLEAIFCTLLMCNISNPPFTFAEFGSMALVTMPTNGGTPASGRQLLLPPRAVAVESL